MPFDPSQGPTDPFAPFHAALAAKLASAPSGETVVHHAGGVLSGLPASFSAFFDELFGGGQGSQQMTMVGSAPMATAYALGNFANIGSTRTTGSGSGTAVDLTDPSVSLGPDQKLSTAEEFIRGARYLGRAMHGAALGRVGPLTPTSGIENLMANGELAQPSTDREKFLLAAAPMLVQMGVFSPLGVNAGLRAVTGAAGARTLGGVALQLGKGAVESGAVATGFTAADQATRGTVPGYSNPSGPEATSELKRAFAVGAGFSLGIGAFVHFLGGLKPMTPIKQAQAAQVLEAANEGELGKFVPGPGMVIDGKQAVANKNGIRWRFTDGENKGKFTTAPDEAAIRNFGKNFVGQVQQRVAQTPEGQAQTAQAAVVSPDQPQTLPTDIRGQQQRMQTIGALYFKSQAGKLFNFIRSNPNGGELLQRELQNLREMTLDATLPLDERITAGGHVMALERVLSQHQTVPGLVPFDQEVAAVHVIKNVMPKMGKQGVMDYASEIAISGNPELAQRIRALAEQGELPRGLSPEIAKRLDVANRAQTKGIKTGSTVLYQGQPHTVVDKPQYGLTGIKDTSDPQSPLRYVDASELSVVPKAGSRVKTADSKVVKVAQVIPDQGIVAGTDVHTGSPVQVPLEILLKTTEDESAERSVAYEEKQTAKPDMKEAVSVPPTKAVTKSGEPVTVTKVSQAAMEVKTRSGQTKTLPRDQVVESTASPQTTANAIRDFAPGTRPEKGNKMLFFRVQEANAAAFEEAAQAGQLTPDVLRRLVVDRATPKEGLTMTPHVLPPPMDATPAKLYSVELPAEDTPMKNYSDLAKGAIGALQGKNTIDSYFSPVDVPPDVFAKGKFSRVADHLIAAAQRPSALLGVTPQEELTPYLRGLLDMNEHVESEYTEAAEDVRDAHAAAAAAQEQGSGVGLAMADAKAAESSVKAITAVLKAEQGAPSLQAMVDQMLKGAQATDPEAVQRRTFEQMGYTPVTAEYYFSKLRELPAVPERTPEDRVYIAPSKNIPGQNMFIVRRSRMSSQVDAAGKAIPALEHYYELSPVTPDGTTLREAVKQVPTEQGVADHLLAEGYVPSLLEQHASGWVHDSKPTLSASVRPLPTGDVEALINERKESPYQQAQGGLTPEQMNILVQLGEHHLDVGSGATRFLEKARQTFKTSDEAEAWLKSQHFQQVDNGADLSTTGRFAQLPPISDLVGNADALRRLHGEVGSIVLDAIRMHNRVPDALVTYAAQFAKLFHDEVGSPPFSRELRKVLGAPTIEDLGPRPPQSVDPSTMVLPNLSFKKGFVPTPKIDHVGDLPGVYPVGSALDVETAMHSTAAPPLKLPDDHQFLFANILGTDEGPSFPNLDAAALRAKQQAYLSTWSEAWQRAQAQAESGPQQFAPAKLSLGRYGPTGQIVNITDVPLDNDEVGIKFPDGAEMRVSKDLVEPSKGSQKDSHDYAMAKAILEGRYDQFFKREPPMGFGKIEQEMGLLGSSDRRLINQQFAQKAYEYAAQLIGKGEAIQGPEEATTGLLDLYNRAQWVHSETPAVFESKGLSLNTPEHVLDAIRAVDPELEKPFRFAAYQRARATAGDTPYGDLRAKAMAGMLEPHQVTALEDARTAMHLSKTLPLGRVVDEAAARRMLDPQVARIAQVFQNELGGLFWADRADLGANVRVKIPAVKDIGFAPGGVSLHIPYKMMLRHPLSMLFDNLQRMAGVREQRLNQGLLELSADLHQNGGVKLGKGSEDSNYLHAALRTFTTWEEAKSGGVPEKYQYSFNQLRKYLDSRLEDHIRMFLQRDIQPQYLDLAKIRAERDPQTGAPGRTETFLEREGMKLDDLAEGAAILSPYKVEGTDFAGAERSSWTHDDIESFLSLRRQYKTSAELPAGTDPRFVDNFDFWKRYGRKNYVPLIHEGNIGLTVNRGGKDMLVGWAPTMYDAAQAYRALLAAGRVGADEHVTFAPKGQVADDVLMRSSTKIKQGEWNRIMDMFGKHIEADGDDIQMLLARRQPDNQGKPELPGKGFLASAQPRTANLKPVFPDLMQDLGLYTGRIARAQYRLDVVNAMNLLTDENLDRSLSTAHGVPMLKEMPNLRRMVFDIGKRALGEYTSGDYIADMVEKFRRWSVEAPVELVRKALGGESPLPWSEIINPETYARKYGARARASQIIGMQALRKLWMSPMSAFVNWFQYLQNSASLLPMKEILPAWMDGHRVWGANTFGTEMPSHLQALAPLIKDIGVDLMPAKQLAGGGSNWGDLTGNIPTRAGTTALGYAGEMGKYWGMMAFNGGEQTGRFATAIGALRSYLSDHGVDPESAASIKAHPDVAGEASAYARRLVDKSYFRYDELAMPSAFAKLGPIGRLLFQFKPFIIQQIGLEKDLLMDAFMKRTPDAMKALGGHMAVLGMLGGATGLFYHPVLSWIGGLTKMITHKDVLDIAGARVPLTPEALQAQADYRREQRATPQQMFQGSMNYHWDDLLYYGVPGLLHMNLGSRLGVSGQDILPDFSAGLGKLVQSELGPTFGLYPQVVDTWAKYIQQKGTGAGVLGGLAGSFAGSQLFRGYPLSGIGGGLGGASLASRGAANPYTDFLNTSREGRTLMRSILPVAVRNGLRTWELFSTGNITNLDNEPEYIPAANRTEEMLAMAFGGESIRRSEYSAVISFQQAQSARMELMKETLVDEMAEAYKEGDYAKAWDAAYRAQQMGVYIPESAVQGRLEDLTHEAVTTVQQRQSVATRYSAP